MARTDKMKLGTFVYTFGFHPASWLHPASDVNGANDFSHLLDVAKRSEEAKFDFMFMADSPAAAVGDPDALSRIPTKMNRFEPVSLLAALSVTTKISASSPPSRRVTTSPTTSPASSHRSII